MWRWTHTTFPLPWLVPHAIYTDLAALPDLSSKLVHPLLFVEQGNAHLLHKRWLVSTVEPLQRVQVHQSARDPVDSLRVQLR